MQSARVQLLGPARLIVGDNSGDATGNASGNTTVIFADDKRHQLLAYLACKAQWVAREQLAFLFWSESDSQSARKNLRHLIQRTKGLSWLQSIQPNFEVEPEHLRWQISCDVRAFKAAFERGDWPTVLTLYRGTLLEGFNSEDSLEFAAWLEGERENLQTQWHSASLHQAKKLHEQGISEDALRILEKLLQHDPLDEEALHDLMQVANQTGQRNTALKAFIGFSTRLKNELNLPPPLSLERLANSIRANENTPVQVQVQEIPSSSPLHEQQPLPKPLPISNSPFVGREGVLAELAHLLERHRLITLVGQGGVGKTRVALHFVEALIKDQTRAENTSKKHFEVSFVDLAAVSLPSAIPTTIAEVLQVKLQGAEGPLYQVIQEIGSRKILLLIDNFEHLMVGATYLNELLKHCPHLVLLITSREGLGLQGEQILPIEAFFVPENGEFGSSLEHNTTDSAKDSVVDFEEGSRLEAVQLFQHHALRVRPNFQLRDHLPQVLEICRLVGGLPLGIELAAVWVRALPIAEIAQEIAENLDFLTSRDPQINTRHRSIRAAFEYSWQLLTAQEQQVLRCLSVFRGGFSREAVKRAVHVPLAVLGSLIDKSLLNLNPAGRYQRHALLYQYMQEKLEQNPLEATQARSNHAQYYFGLLNTALIGIRGQHSRVVLEMLETELENIRVALRWAVEKENLENQHGERAGQTLGQLKEACEPLMRLFSARGRYQEGIDLFGTLLTHLEESNPAHHGTLGAVLVNQSKCHLLRGQAKIAEQTVLRGLELLRPLEGTVESETYVAGLGTLASIVGTKGDHPNALAIKQEALTRARSSQNSRQIAMCLGWVATTEHDQGQYEAAKLHYQEAVDLFNSLENPIGALYNLSDLGQLWLDTGNAARAKPILHQALELSHATGELNISVESILGRCYLELGDFAAALEYSQFALEQAQRFQRPDNEAELLLQLGLIYHKQANPKQARAHLVLALGVAWKIQHLPLVMAILTDYAFFLIEMVQDQPFNQMNHPDHILQLVSEHSATVGADLERIKKHLEKYLEVEGNQVLTGSLELESVVRAIRYDLKS